MTLKKLKSGKKNQRLFLEIFWTYYIWKLHNYVAFWVCYYWSKVFLFTMRSAFICDIWSIFFAYIAGSIPAWKLSQQYRAGL